MKRSHANRRLIAKLLSTIIVAAIVVGLIHNNVSVEAAAMKLNATKKTLYYRSPGIDVPENEDPEEDEGFYQTYTLKLKNKPSSAKVTWKSSKSSVATVSSNGKVTAVKKGTATITATCNGETYKCKITVKKAGFSIGSAVDIEVGEKLVLKVAGDSVDAFKSSDRNVLKVSTATGKITGKKPGRATVTAICENGKYSVDVYVDYENEDEDEVTTQPVLSPTEAPTAEPIVSGTPVQVMSVKIYGGDVCIDVNESIQLYAQVNPENAINKSIQWVTGNSTVAAVSDTGRVSAFHEGKTYIFAYADNGVFGITEIEVMGCNPTPVPEEQVKYTPTPTPIAVDESGTWTTWYVEPNNTYASYKTETKTATAYRYARYMWNNGVDRATSFRWIPSGWTLNRVSTSADDYNAGNGKYNVIYSAFFANPIPDPNNVGWDIDGIHYWEEIEETNHTYYRYFVPDNLTEVKDTTISGATGKIQKWTQGDQRWKNYAPGISVAQYGCAETSICIQLAYSGLVSVDEGASTYDKSSKSGFNPGSFAKAWNANGGLSNCCSVTWNTVNNLVPGFNVVIDQKYHSSGSTAFSYYSVKDKKTVVEEMRYYLEKGYYPIVEGPGSGFASNINSRHYVAVVKVSEDDVIVVDTIDGKEKSLFSVSPAGNTWTLSALDACGNPAGCGCCVLYCIK